MNDFYFFFLRFHLVAWYNILCSRNSYIHAAKGKNKQTSCGNLCDKRGICLIFFLLFFSPSPHSRLLVDCFVTYELKFSLFRKFSGINIKIYKPQIYTLFIDAIKSNLKWIEKWDDGAEKFWTKFSTTWKLCNYVEISSCLFIFLYYTRRN